MGWYDYFTLLERHNGDLSKASVAELAWAARGNPNTPVAARAGAEEAWADRLRGADVDCEGAR
jgi:hypothetical protein